MTRKEAARLGLVKYETDAPCKHGHAPIRYTATGVCVACAIARSKANARSVSNWIKANRPDAVELRGVLVHPDDVATILDLADLYNVARGLPPTSRALVPAPPRDTRPKPNLKFLEPDEKVL